MKKRQRKRVEEVGDVTHFAHGFNFYKLFWVFFITCFLGVVLETAFVWITTGHYMNRTGLVYGPFNLVYGVGALLMTLSMYWLRQKRDMAIFMGGMVLGGAYEFACSWLQETVFGTVSWDYSEMPFNLGGRINLLYCFFWGFLGLIWVKDLYPRISNWIEKYVPKTFGVILTWVLVAFMLVNIGMSAGAVARMSLRFEGAPADNAAAAFFDEHFPDERMARIYPSMERVEK